MMQGKAGMTPRIMKEMKVTIPFFLATSSSSTTRPNSSSIMMLTKACLLVEQSSAILLESSRLKPLARQMSMIYFFSSFKRLSTSQSSLASSDLMYLISARAERQSPRPIPIPSPTIAQMQRVKMRQDGSPDDTPLRMMRRVLMQPSKPPQTRDFRYSPASMWSSEWSFSLSWASRGLAPILASDIILLIIKYKSIRISHSLLHIPTSGSIYLSFHLGENFLNVKKKYYEKNIIVRNFWTYFQGIWSLQCKNGLNIFQDKSAMLKSKRITPSSARQTPSLWEVFKDHQFVCWILKFHQRVTIHIVLLL